MEGTAFIIHEARTSLESIRSRVANMREGPATTLGLAKQIDNVNEQIGALEESVQSAPAAIRDSFRTMFDDTLRSVRDVLHRSNLALESVCSKAYPENVSGTSSRLRSLFYRAFYASAISDTVNALQSRLSSSSIELSALTSMIIQEQKLQDRHNEMVSKFIPLQTGDEKYRVGANTPILPRGTTLNFGERYAGERKSTPEKALKDAILSHESSSLVTAAVVGVVGMVGVGKTVALQGLAFDADIRAHFPDGIHYIELGLHANEPTAIGAIARLMRLTGASASVSDVEKSPSLKDAVDFAVPWFEGKTCLFLVDDLWPTKYCETGVLNDLRQLLRSCPRSRLVVTTRSRIVASDGYAGRVVDFVPRDPLGPVSLKIFMMHATRDSTRAGSQEPKGMQRKSIETILSFCAGLPLALVVTGCGVAFLKNEFGDLGRACDIYAARLEKQRFEVCEMHDPCGANLSAGIFLSLEFLEAGLAKLAASSFSVIDYTITDLYISLCVLKHQAWVSVSVLSGMWNVDQDIAFKVAHLFHGLSLCKLTFPQQAQGLEKECGLELHDLLLDFCKRQADKMKTSSEWHTRFQQQSRLSK